MEGGEGLPGEAVGGVAVANSLTGDTPPSLLAGVPNIAWDAVLALVPHRVVLAL